MNLTERLHRLPDEDGVPCYEIKAIYKRLGYKSKEEQLTMKMLEEDSNDDSASGSEDEDKENEIGKEMDEKKDEIGKNENKMGRMKEKTEKNRDGKKIPHQGTKDFIKIRAIKGKGM